MLTFSWLCVKGPVGFLGKKCQPMMSPRIPTSATTCLPWCQTKGWGHNIHWCTSSRLSVLPEVAVRDAQPVCTHFACSIYYRQRMFWSFWNMPKYYNRRGTVYVKMITDIHSHSVCVCDCCLVLIFRKGYLCDGVCVYVCLCVLHKHTHIIFQQVVTMFLFLTIQEVEVLFCSSVLIGSWWIFEIESEKCFQEYIVISLWHVDMKKESNILMIDINKSLILICFTSCFIMFPPVGCDLVLICCRLYLQQVLLLRGPQKCLGSTSHCIFMRNFFKVACE